MNKKPTEGRYSSRTKASSSDPKKWAERLQVVLASIAVVASVSSIGPLLETLDWFKPRPPKREASDTHAEIVLLKRELTELKSRIGALTKVSPEAGVSSRLDQISISQKSLGQKMRSIEEIILKDPAEALAIPILRKDIERLQELNQTQMASLAADLERTYTLVIATLIALALAVLAPALTNLLNRRRTAAIDDRPSNSPNTGAQADG